MIRVSDAANTRKTDDAATQRKSRFVKHAFFQHPHVQRLHSPFSNVSGIRTLRSAAPLTTVILAGIALAFPPRAEAVVRLGSANTVSLSNGLVGYWPLDGSVTNWNTNTTADVSGNGNTGTLVSLATTSAPVAGKIGQALKFDGSTSYVSIGDVAPLKITGAISTSAWIYLKSSFSSGFGAAVSNPKCNSAA